MGISHHDLTVSPLLHTAFPSYIKSLLGQGLQIPNWVWQFLILTTIDSDRDCGGLFQRGWRPLSIPALIPFLWIHSFLLLKAILAFHFCFWTTHSPCSWRSPVLWDLHWTVPSPLAHCSTIIFIPTLVIQSTFSVQGDNPAPSLASQILILLISTLSTSSFQPPISKVTT